MQGSDRGTKRRDLLRWTGWFLSANTCLLLLGSSRYWTVIGPPEGLMAWIFLTVAFTAHLLTLALAPAPVIALVILLWPRRWLVILIGVVLSGLLLGGLVVDAIVYSLYRFHLNGMVWSMFRNGGLRELLPLSASTWAVAWALLGGALALEAGLAALIWRWIKVEYRHGPWVVAAALTLVASEHLLNVWAFAVHHTPITKHVRVLPGYQPLSANRHLSRWGWIKPDAESALQLPVGTTHLHYPLAPLTCQPPARPLNILIIVIDGWRFDMLKEAVTPNVFRLGQQSLRFENHSAAANATRFGIFSLFYGLYGTYWHAMLGEQRGPLLITQLNRAGYQFGVFATAPLTSPEFDRTVFSEIRHRIPLHTDGGTTPQRDQIITRRFDEFLDARDRARPFFGFLFYDSTHAYDYPPDAPAPFQPACARVEHLKLSNTHDPIPVHNRFLNATHFVDSLVGQVFERLRREELLASTVVLVTGDHGQEFNDTGGNYWGHNGNFSRYQNKVPLVLHWPGRTPATFTHLTSHLDVAPTLLHGVLGCSADPATYSNGLVLFDQTPRVPLLSASWNQVALHSPGRIDVFFSSGQSDHYDEDYREAHSPIPPGLLLKALQGMSRFYN